LTRIVITLGVMKKYLSLLFTTLLCFQSTYLIPQTQTYEVSVNTVTVWVRVLDKDGSPVKGLKAEDFEIHEDKQKVPLTCFEEVGVPKTDASSASSESISKKRLVIYLDLFNLSSAEYDDLRPTVNKFLETIPEERWEIMMAAFLPDGKLRILVQPTNNFDQIRSMLESLPPQSRRDIDLVKKIKDIETILRFNQSIDQERIIRRACQIANGFANEERGISQFSLNALDTLMDSISKQEPSEQKVIAHFSAGFNSEPGRVYYEMIEEILKLDLDELSLNIPECRRDLSFHPAKNVQKTLGGMNRSNVTLYSIHTRTLYPGLAIQLLNSTVNISESSILSDYKFYQEAMAEESGGKFFPNLLKFNQNINSMLMDLEHQYILCYRQPEQSAKSEYRNIKVLCKKSGLEVRHRQGYVN
jgi:VWFA-related protein